MKTHAKTMRKALSLVLTIAILMSACAVMLSTFTSAYTAYTPVSNTYTWDFTTGKGIANWTGNYPSRDAEFTSEGFHYYTQASNGTSAQLGTPDATFIDGSSEEGVSPFVIKENATYKLKLEYILKAGTAYASIEGGKIHHNPTIQVYTGVQTAYETAIGKKTVFTDSYDIDALYASNPEKFTVTSHTGGIIDPATDPEAKYEFELYTLKEDIKATTTCEFNTAVAATFYKGENFRDNLFFTISAGAEGMVGNDDKSFGANRGRHTEFFAKSDVVLVSATLEENAPATSSTESVAKTYVYNFIDDETGESAYNYAIAGTDYTDGKYVKADENGLLYKTLNRNSTSNGNGTAASYQGIKVMDPDFGLGSESALKFEAGNDYGIVVKYKVANDAELRAQFPDYFSTTSNPYKLLFGFDAQNASKPLQFGTSLLYGNGSVDKWLPGSSTDATTANAVKVTDDGWRYFYYQFTGSNFDARENITSDGRYFIMDFGYDDTSAAIAVKPTVDAQLLIESVTVTVVKCDNAHSHIEGAYGGTTKAIKTFNMTTYVDNSGKIVDMKYVHPSQTFGTTPDGKYDYYESDTLRTTPRGDHRGATEYILNYTVNVDTNKIPKTSIDVYDFTSAEAITAYNTYPYHYHVSNIKNATGGGNGNSYIDETSNGLYYYSGVSGGNINMYNYTHTFSIKGINGHFVTGATSGFSQGLALRFLPGKKYRIEVEYDADTNVGLNLGVSTAVNGTDANDTRYLVIQKWTSPVSSGLRTAVFELDSDQTWNFPVADVTEGSAAAYMETYGQTLYGSRIKFSTNANGAITVKKVTVYTADKNASIGDDVIADVGNGYEILKAGDVLVDPASVNGTASLGWECEGAMTTTVTTAQLATYEAVYPINNSYDFSNGRNDLYMPGRPNLPTVDDPDSWGYEFIEDAGDGHGAALELTGKTNVLSQGSGSSLGFSVPSAPGLGDTSGVVLENGKTYTISFDVKALILHEELINKPASFGIYIAHDSGIGAASHKTLLANEFGKDEFVNSLADGSWQTVTRTITLRDNTYYCPTTGTCGTNQIPLTSIYVVMNYGALGHAVDAREIHAKALIDNFRIVCNDDELYTNVADDVKSSIRAESGSGESYVSAGVRFRASVDDATIAAADEIGFIAIPSASANGKWYDMTALNANVKRAKVYVKNGAHTIYNDNDGYNEYQLIVSGLTKEGATNNGKALDIVAVLYIKTGDTYEYKFVRDSSYNEVKQMYINSDIPGAEDY